MRGATLVLACFAGVGAGCPPPAAPPNGRDQTPVATSIVYDESARCSTALVTARHPSLGFELRVVDLRRPGETRVIPLGHDPEHGMVALAVDAGDVLWMGSRLGIVEARDACTGALLLDAAAIRARNPGFPHVADGFESDTMLGGIVLRAQGHGRLRLDPKTFAATPVAPDWHGRPGWQDCELEARLTSDSTFAWPDPVLPAASQSPFLRERCAPLVLQGPESVLTVAQADVARVGRDGHALWTSQGARGLATTAGARLVLHPEWSHAEPDRHAVFVAVVEMHAIHTADESPYGATFLAELDADSGAMRSHVRLW